MDISVESRAFEPAASASSGPDPWWDAMLLVAILFVIKASLVAFLVTPVWDVPDEVGHFAYVMSLADQGKIPVPGESPLPEEILKDWKGPGELQSEIQNWTAQHPPLYYYSAVPFLRIARLITADLHRQVRITRIDNVLIGAFSLLVLFLAVREMTGDSRIAFVAGGSTAFVPMYTHLSAGVTNDVATVLLVSGAAFFWGRFFRRGRLRDGFSMAALLGLAGAVKLTAVPIAGGVILTACLHLRSRGWRWVRDAAGIGVTALALPVVWWLRTVTLMKRPVLVNPGAEWSFPGMLSFLRAHPVFDHTVKNFFGLIGWTGTGGGEVHWFQITGWCYLPWVIVGLATVCGAFFWMERRIAWEKGPWRGWRMGVGVMAALVALGVGVGLWNQTAPFQAVRHFWHSLTLGLTLFVLALPAVKDPRKRITLSALCVFAVFLVAYLMKVYDSFRFFGVMRGTHGRYFYGTIPFLAAGVLAPAMFQLRERWPRLERWAVLVPPVLFVAEVVFFLVQVLPFYREGVVPR